MQQFVLLTILFQTDRNKWQYRTFVWYKRVQRS